MKEEDNILKKVGKKNSFKVPEGYFENLTSEVMGKLPEKEGPALAEQMLSELGFEKDVIERVSFLVGHHHTYTGIDGLDYQILVEADFLVNLFEGNTDTAHIRATYDNIFRTETGKKICREMFGL